MELGGFHSSERPAVCALVYIIDVPWSLAVYAVPCPLIGTAGARVHSYRGTSLIRNRLPPRALDIVLR